MKINSIRMNKYYFLALAGIVLLAGAGCRQPVTPPEPSVVPSPAAPSEQPTTTKVEQPSATPTEMNAPIQATTSRILLDVASANALLKEGLPAKFNTEIVKPPSYKYENTDVSMLIPYDKAWGNEQYGVKPYEGEGQGGILFGPIITGYGDPGISVSWERMFSFGAESTETFAKVLAGPAGYSCEGIRVPRTALKLSNFSAVRYESSSCEGGMAEYILFGKKHNYSISVNSIGPEADALLKQIAETLKEK